MKRTRLMLCHGFMSMALLGGNVALADEVKKDIHDPDTFFYFSDEVNNKSRSITLSEKKKFLADFQKEAKTIKMPQEMVDLVSVDSIYDKVIDYSGHSLGDEVLMYYKDGMVIALFTPPKMDPIIMISRYLIKKDDVANPVQKSFSPNNPLSKEPYFSIDKSLQSKLEDPERLMLIHKILSTNFSAFMGVAGVDKRAFESGELMGKILHQPIFTYDRQPPTLGKDVSEEEIKLRALLGYYVGDIVSVSALETSRLSPVAFPFRPYMWDTSCAIDLSLRYDVHSSKMAWIHCINDTAYYEGTKYQFMRAQIRNKAEYLGLMLEGLTALTEEAGVDRNDKKAKLTPDQEMLAGWCNTLERYMLMLNAMAITDLSDTELEKLKTLASFIGKENKKPIADGETEKIDSWGKKLSKKREAWKKKDLERSRKNTPS